MLTFYQAGGYIIPMDKYTPKSISVFFLARNDENTIGGLVEKADRLLKRLSFEYEIIVGNDASSDHTLDVLNKLEKKIPALRILNHKTNQGYGGNLISGLKAAKNEFVFYTDGDGQYDPRELTRLVDHLAEDVDVVNGYKSKRSDNIARIIIGKAYAKWVRFIFRIKLRDTDCDFRLIRKSFLDKIELKSKSGAICPELVIKLQKAGARFVETPVSHYPRRYGRSQFFTPIRIVRTFSDEYRLLEMFYYETFRKIKFILVGCSSLLVQLTFFNIFILAFKWNPTFSTFASDEFAILTSFFLNNALTFRDRRFHLKDGLSKIVKRFFKYNYITAVAIVIQTGTVFVGTKLFGESYLTVHFLFLLGILIGMAWNYTLHNIYVWPKDAYAHDKTGV